MENITSPIRNSVNWNLKEFEESVQIKNTIYKKLKWMNKNKLKLLAVLSNALS